MNTDDPDAILELAALLADAAVIDWDDWRTQRPDLTPRVDALAEIERIAAVHREARHGKMAADDGATAGGDAARAADRAATAPRDRWGPLLVHERIGSGAFGEVFRAVDPRLDREVALKLRRLEGRRGLDARRFLDEARHLARIQHPHVVAVYGADIDRGRAGIWTELVAGPTLEVVLADGPLETSRLVTIGRQLCAAVSAVHAEGLIHGDITARNVLLDEAGRVRLTDFGCASASHEASASLIGTPLSTAPEVLAGGPVTPRADIYSLGALLHRLATGAHPLEAGSLDELISAHASHRRTPTAMRHPEVPVDLARAIDRALEPDPADRFASAVALDEALACAGLASGCAAETRPRAGVLPATRTSFFGRERECERIEEALRTGRWVSLVGPGGGGKTRLAIEVARTRSALYPDGVWFLTLASIARGRDVPREVAEVLGLRPGRDLERQVAAHVRPWRALLVLDNCEHVLDDVASIGVRLLESAPRLHLLATSREPVNVEGERVIDVGGLPLPAAADDVADPDRGLRGEDEADPPEDEADAPSVRLLADRLRAAGHESEVPRRVLHELVHLAGGLPLAIELIAAATRGRDPGTLVSELGAGLPDLRGRRGAVARHASLEDVVAWSHGRLPFGARHVLERLSVFRGGASLDAVRAVCHDMAAERVSAALDELERVSLIQSTEPTEQQQSTPHGASTSAAPRWHLLEPTRQFAERRLIEAGRLEATRDAHLDFFVDAAAAPSRRDAAAYARHLATMPCERDNLRAAVCWAAADERRHATGRQLIAALEPLWSDGRPDYRLQPELETLVGDGPVENVADLLSIRCLAAMRAATGDDAGGIELLRRGLEAARALDETLLLTRFEILLVTRLTVAGEVAAAGALIDSMLAHVETLGDPWVTARAQRAHAGFLQLTGDVERAALLARDSEASCRTLGDLAGVYYAATLAGRLAYTAAEYGQAAKHEERSLEVLSAMPAANPRLLAASRNSLAVYVSQSGDKERAMRLYREALAISRRHGFRALEMSTLANMGEEARLQGDLERAIVLLREAQENMDGSADPFTQTQVDTSLGMALADSGRREEARQALSTGLDGALLLGDRESAILFFHLAQVARSTGSPALAARLHGVVERLAREGGVPALLSGDEAVDDRASLVETLGEVGFERERCAGRELSHDEAVALARTVPELDAP